MASIYDSNTELKTRAYDEDRTLEGFKLILFLVRASGAGITKNLKKNVK